MIDGVLIKPIAISREKSTQPNQRKLPGLDPIVPVPTAWAGLVILGGRSSLHQGAMECGFGSLPSLQVSSESNHLSESGLRYLPGVDLDGDIDRDRTAHRFHAIDEPEQFLVRVMAVLVRHRRVERQIDRKQAMPLHVVDELRIGGKISLPVPSFARCRPR